MNQKKRDKKKLDNSGNEEIVKAIFECHKARIIEIKFRAAVIVGKKHEKRAGSEGENIRKKALRAESRRKERLQW